MKMIVFDYLACDVMGCSARFILSLHLIEYFVTLDFGIETVEIDTLLH